MAAVQCVQCGGQFDGEAVVGGESVGGVLGASAERGVGQRTRDRPESDQEQHSPGHPSALLHGADPGHGQTSGQNDAQSRAWVTAGQGPRQTSQRASRYTPRRSEPCQEQYRPSRPRGVVAQLVDEQGHQLTFRHATGGVVLHDPTGDRDAASAGGVRVGRPSGLNVELDANGSRSGHSQGRRPGPRQRRRLRRAEPATSAGGAKDHPFADPGDQHGGAGGPRHRKEQSHPVAERARHCYQQQQTAEDGRRGGD
jgi:hypothetical protein